MCVQHAQLLMSREYVAAVSQSVWYEENGDYFISAAYHIFLKPQSAFGFFLKFKHCIIFVIS